MILQTLHFDDLKKPVSFRDIWEMFGQHSYRLLSRKAISGLVGVAVAFVILGAVTAVLSGHSIRTRLITMLILLSIPLIIVAFMVEAILRTVKRAIRLKRFAAQNGFNFAALRECKNYPGLVFTMGRDRQFLNVVSGTFHGLPFAFGNFYCTVGSGKNSKRRSFGVIEVTLTRKLPHILLDARANNSLGFSNLPYFQRNQHLKLEGNFNDYFTLYVPDGYQRDALYFITPELMALLIDFGANFDIEIVEDRLYIYSNKESPTQKQQTLEQIFRLIEVVGAEVHENTSRYADANVGDRQANAVAEPGRRLQRTGPWLVIVIASIFIFVMLWFQISST